MVLYQLSPNTQCWCKVIDSGLSGTRAHEQGRTATVLSSHVPLNGQAATMITNDRQQEKESMAEFIAKKREMFLVQMSLDTKREEIRKLEEKARMKEEALRKSEQVRSIRIYPELNMSCLRRLTASTQL